VNLTEATKVTETEQRAETDHLIATDTRIQAAAAEEDQTAEIDILETEHPPTIDHPETRTNIDQNHVQAIIQEAPETDP